MNSIWKPAIVACLGFSFCLLVAALPEIVPGLVKKQGYIWSPVNSLTYRSDDAYHLVPWMMRIAPDQLLIGSPSVQSKSAELSVEILRFSSIILAALPRLVFSDPRFVILTVRCLFPALLFVLCFWFLFSWTKRISFSFLLALYMLFYCNAWAILIFSTSVLRPIEVFFGYPIWILGLNSYDDLNSNFRFISTAVSSCILLWFIISLLRLERRGGWRTFVMAVIAGFLTLFAYPTQATLAFITLSGLILCFYVEGRTEESKRFAATAASIGGLVIFIGICTAAVAFSSVNEVVAVTRSLLASYGQVAASGESLWPAVVKFLCVEAVTLACAWNEESLRRWLMALGATGLVFFLAAWGCGSNYLYFKSFFRAYAFIWLGFVIVAIYTWLRPRWLMLSERMGERQTLFQWLLGVILVAGLMIVPVVGFGNMAWKRLHDSKAYIRVTQWDMLKWLEHNTPADSVIMALDWDDVTLIPIYSRRYVFFGHRNLNNRTAYEEVLRYFTAWDMLGLPRSELQQLIEHSLDNVGQLGEPRETFDLDLRFESAHFAAGLLYWPCFPDIAEVPFAAADGKTVSPQVVEMLMQWYDDKVWQSAIPNARVDFIAVSRRYWNRSQTLGQDATLELLYENQDRRIYRIRPNERPAQRGPGHAHKHWDKSGYERACQPYRAPGMDEISLDGFVATTRRLWSSMKSSMFLTYANLFYRSWGMPLRSGVAINGNCRRYSDLQRSRKHSNPDYKAVQPGSGSRGSLCG